MSMMYKIFWAILAAGAGGGALFALWAHAFGPPTWSLSVFVGLSAAVGLAYGFVNYVFVKSVLRIFVNKFQTLERVLVGTTPNPLPNVFLSNEIDEIEASIVRITERFDKLTAATGGMAGRMEGSRPSLRAAAGRTASRGGA